jgi:hypothetical protein
MNKNEQNRVVAWRLKLGKSTGAFYETGFSKSLCLPASGATQTTPRPCISLSDHKRAP